MTKKKTAEKEIYRIPGRLQLQSFLQKHSKLFNFSEMERICEFPSGTLRYVCAGTREMNEQQYSIIQERILPKICELVLLLQLYNSENIPYDLRTSKSRYQ